MGMYVETLYIASDGNARKTNVGAEWETDEETRAAFNSLKRLDADPKKGDFIFDLHADNGDILDTVSLTSESFELITGEKALSEEDYCQIDDKHWA
jgi:hypothetical protein